MSSCCNAHAFPVLTLALVLSAGGGSAQARGEPQLAATGPATLYVWETAVVDRASAPAYEAALEKLAAHYAHEGYPYPHVVLADDTVYHAWTGIASYEVLGEIVGSVEASEPCAQMRREARAVARSSTLHVLRLRPDVAAADFAEAAAVGSYLSLEVAHLRPGTESALEKAWTGWTELFESLGIDLWWTTFAGEVGFDGPTYVGLMVGKDSADIAAKQGRLFTEVPELVRELQAKETPYYRLPPMEGGIEFIHGWARPEWSYWPGPPPLVTPRYNFGATVHEGRIFVVGGTVAPVGENRSAPATASVEMLDPASGAWTEVTRLTSPRTHAAACSLGGLIYVVGGAPEERVEPLGIVEAWDPRTGEWSRKADLPTPRMNAACVPVGGKLLAIGGQVSDGVATVEAYDPAQDRWERRADLLTARAHLIAAEVDGRVFAIGGAVRAGTRGVVEEFDPVADRWLERVPMATPRTSLAAAVVDGRIYVVGGSERPGGVGLTTVEAYDPGTDTWSLVPPLSGPRVALAAVAHGEVLYAIGGSRGPWPFEPLDSVEAMRLVSRVGGR